SSKRSQSRSETNDLARPGTRRGAHLQIIGPWPDFCGNTRCSAFNRMDPWRFSSVRFSSVAELGELPLQFRLEGLDVGGRGFVTLLLGRHAQLPVLIQVPNRLLPVAERHAPADHGARPRHGIHAYGNFSANQPAAIRGGGRTGNE